jgi:DNA modification methylase
MEEINSNLQFKENPRKISDDQLDQLSNHLLKFGDLGGIVYCQNNKSYVGGNQRSKIFDGAKIEIIQSFDTPQSDKTVAFGFIHWNGNRYLYREVEFTEEEFREACIAANKDGGEWDLEALKSWDINLLSQWDWNDDVILHQETQIIEDENEDDICEIPKKSACKIGDTIQLNNHILICGDSTKKYTFETLLSGSLPDMVFTDPPYNLPADKIGNKGQTKHKNFINAAGEMTSSEFTCFLNQVFSNLSTFTKQTSMHFICMDWRHIKEVLSAITDLSYQWKNLIVWNKDLNGMGSCYNNKHELIFLFENGDGPYTKNFKYGTRSNVWDYPSANSLSTQINSDDNGMLKEHPTPKPVAMVSDAILDLSNEGDIILDAFTGSGTTLIACEKTNRIFRGVEFEPKYCDLIIKRYMNYCDRNEIECVVTVNEKEISKEDFV